MTRYSLIIALAILSAIAGTANAQQDQRKTELDMVYVGAYWMHRSADLFSQHAAEDLGVKVRFWPRRTGGLVWVATDRLSGGGAWDIVDDADIVFIMLTGNFDHQEGFCLDTVGETPFGDSQEKFRKDIEEFLAELDRNVDLDTTMVRVGLPAVMPYFRALWVERDVVEECSRAWSTRLDQWRESAASYGIPVIDVTSAWNGSDASVASPEEYFVTDRTHLNEQGAQAVAELMREGGYAPLQ